MKKLLFVLVISGFMFGCNSENNKESDREDEVEVKNEMEVSFEILHRQGNIIVGYTNDHDSLWINPEWYIAMKVKMKTQKNGDVTVLLFNSKENTPNIMKLGFDYPSSFDKHMVCGYWKFNYEKFCYGGIKEDGNFEVCEER